MELAPDILRTFVASAQSLSFTKAAELVNLTQSAVSLQIRKLERQLGKSLFRRMSRGVELTDEGRSLLNYAVRLLQLHDEAIASVSQKSLEGVVRIGASEDFASIHLPGILKRFADHYPLVQVSLFCDLSNSLFEMLNEGKLDLCLCSMENLEKHCTFLRNEPTFWITSKDAEPEKISPLPLALYPSDCVYTKWAMQALDREGIAYRIAYSSPSTAGILAAVQSGLFVAPVGASSLNSNVRILSEDVLPELPSAKVSLYQFDNVQNQARNLFAQYISDGLKRMHPVIAP